MADKKSSNWVWITRAGTVLGILIALFTLWNNMQTALVTVTENITLEIQSQTYDIAELFEDDLRERINVLKADLASREKKNEDIPEIMYFQLRSMDERLEDLKNRGKAK